MTGTVTITISRDVAAALDALALLGEERPQTVARLVWACGRDKIAAGDAADAEDRLMLRAAALAQRVAVIEDALCDARDALRDGMSRAAAIDLAYRLHHIINAEDKVAP